jgi:Uma2 family endonuclease
MASVSERPAPGWSIERLRHHFGGIAAERIRLKPAPGTATDNDLCFANDHSSRICELVDGTLVEKAAGSYESSLAMRLGYALNDYLARRPLGVIAGADGMLRLAAGLIRAPDGAFFFWDRIGQQFPREPAPDLSPDLAIEVVSKSNTKKELERKIAEYFEAGAQCVWLVYHDKETVDVYTGPRKKRTVKRNGTLDGGTLLPGFTLELGVLFAPPPGADQPS